MSGEHELRAALQAVRACRLPGQTVMGIHGPCETGEGWSVSGLTALLPQIDAALATPSPSTDTLEADSGMSGDAVERAELFWANLPTRRKWTDLATHEKALVCHQIARIAALGGSHD